MNQIKKYRIPKHYQFFDVTARSKDQIVTIVENRIYRRYVFPRVKDAYILIRCKHTYNTRKYRIVLRISARRVLTKRGSRK